MCTPVLWKHWVMGFCVTVCPVRAHWCTEMNNVDKIYSTEVCT